eukprot:gnl/TRDRNA2_/TRDRNA2_171097_c1_seq2.p1 gnl/TRDRNA2_/TRDRNA2_171097_c1~~gnl/TRDRNA2_/TRDRNA2_171097_c1_seq2.p1  ORF type:complete len:286 (-),score=61.08 gnl/TRDRNA2_/TRDRNA2_171097_c1_seq2:137-874(-)
MVPAPLSLDTINALLVKAEGRDKLGRTAQYGARMLVGLVALAQPQAKSQLKAIGESARLVMVNLANARRAHRWFKEFAVLKSIPACLKIEDPLERVLDLCQKASLVTFLITDHFGWLKQQKIIKNGKRNGPATIQLGLKWFCLCNAISVIIQVKKGLKLNDSEKPDKGTQQKKCLKDAFKHALLILQTAHLSMLYQSHDALVGFAGIISSMIDVQGQWPEAPKPPPPPLKLEEKAPEDAKTADAK